MAAPTTSGANWTSTVHAAPVASDWPVQLSAMSEKAPLPAASTRVATTVAVRAAGFESETVAVRRPATTTVGSKTTVPGWTSGNATALDPTNVDPNEPLDPEDPLDCRGNCVIGGDENRGGGTVPSGTVVTGGGATVAGGLTTAPATVVVGTVGGLLATSVVVVVVVVVVSTTEPSSDARRSAAHTMAPLWNSTSSVHSVPWALSNTIQRPKRESTDPVIGSAAPSPLISRSVVDVNDVPSVDDSIRMAPARS